jgi:DNA polymerase-3 subunit alpha
MLRRAMGKKKPEVLMGKKKEFIEGAVKQGFTEQHADEIFEIMVPFAGYGFNKSHAAAYSVLAYRTGWLKAHYPAEFMAANLTNEITSTDGLPFYIEEARRMGVPVDAPDVNRSDVIFDVVDGRIVFGLKGIKGMGENAAAAIVKERETNGPFESFMDFIKRVGALSEKDEDGREKTLVNKKAIEVLIKTGAFDNVGKEIGQYYNRPTLLANMEEAIDFVSDVLEDKRNGQGDLFGDLSPEESASTDFQFTIIDDLPTMQLLDMELECIGCYVSGHPLDDYKKAIENSVTLKSSNIARIAAEDKAEKERLQASGAKSWQLKNAGRSFVALGMILDLRVIRTKSTNKEMAFCKLQDLEGSISCTFFPKTWETLKDKIENNGIYAFRGKVDGSRDEPGFLVDTLEDADSLESQSKTSIHLKMDATITSVQNLMPLRDFLFDNMGSCSVYFHLSVGNKPYVVKGGEQLKVAYSSDLLKKLSDMPSVNEVWAE